MEEQKQRLGLILAGLLLGTFVSALDQTIVSTAIGTIVGQLGGLDQFVWVTSAYMATEMAGMPIFGKLSDMYGRKRFFLFGILTFLVGSVLCGTAHSITQLAVYRAIQGIGGGALMPIAFTILFDVARAEQMGKFSGLIGAVFGVSSIAGPLLGSFITDHLGWRWVFYVNVPLGLLACALVGFAYHESRRHPKETIDWLGILTLVPAVACLMFAMEFGGNRYAWTDTPVVALFAGAIVCFAAFFLAEARARAPIVDYGMFRYRLFAGSIWVGLFASAAFIVAVVYIPIYVQGVRGGTATNSGLVLLPMMLGSSFAAPIGGQLANRFRYRTIMWVACAILLAGVAGLSTLTPDTPRWLLTVYMILVGLGIGPSFSVLGMASMHHFYAHQRGAASSTVSFIRELGMTIGITVFGALQRDDFATRLKQAFAGMPGAGVGFGAGAGVGFGGSRGIDPHVLLAPEVRAHIPAPVLDRLTTALSASITHTFLWAILLAALAFVFVFWLGAERWQGFADARGAGAGPVGVAKVPGAGEVSSAGAE
ncbi:MDR family MFS transporter [Alicyclobacillus macrosporangiidus]|uniref:MDR family MFS transporter n=1 Tax=Alicyclobacillus macrosporangiidus TaxID=392015 RepID=UPI00068A5A26|nr:MDR family MFS transporter [Alicyclobacillus macrosporangiidus]